MIQGPGRFPLGPSLKADYLENVVVETGSFPLPEST